MKNTRRWMTTTLCIAALALLISCAGTYIPDDSTVGNMSVREARKIVVQGLLHDPGYHQAPASLYLDLRDGEKRSVVASVYLTSDSLTIVSDNGIGTVLPLRKLQINATFFGDSPWAGIRLNNISVMVSDYGNNAFARSIADALFVLKQAALNPDADETANSARFEEVAQAYKEAATKPTLSEAARKFKVQAEGAIRDKKFYDGADLYGQALEIAPWWPEGHFNRALVLGEVGEYGEAKREMGRYLQLVPGAPNARAAQDQIYEWERKMGKPN